MDAKTDILEREKITVARCEKSSTVYPAQTKGFRKKQSQWSSHRAGWPSHTDPSPGYLATPTASVLLFQRPSTARSLPVTPPTPTPIKGQQRTHSKDSIVATAEGEYSQDDSIIIQVRY